MLEEVLEATARKSGFQRRGDYEVLALVGRSEPATLTPNEVASFLRVSPSGMTGKVDRLEQQGLLERESDSDDRRAVRLVLTEKGRSHVNSAFDESLMVYQSFLNGLSSDQRNILDGLLIHILSQLDSRVPTGQIRTVSSNQIGIREFGEAG
jgi:DNA-binding MarR family transcriptional regulator